MASGGPRARLVTDAPTVISPGCAGVGMARRRGHRREHRRPCDILSLLRATWDQLNHLSPKNQLPEPERFLYRRFGHPSLVERRGIFENTSPCKTRNSNCDANLEVVDRENGLHFLHSFNKFQRFTRPHLLREVPSSWRWGTASPLENQVISVTKRP